MEVSSSGSGDGEVRRISKHTIRSANPETQSTQRLELTPWDLSYLGLHPIQKGIFFHKPKGNTWISDLKTSLSLVLHHFFPLAGRLATEAHDEDGTISIFIECNNAGAEFIHAKADVRLSHVLDQLYVPRIVHDFFSLNYSLNYDGRFKPLLSIQVNELLDGVFIGCSMNHVIADGASFWHFMNSWSEICRGFTTTTKYDMPNPNFNRWFLTESDLPVRLPASIIDQSIQSYNMPQLQERIFHFSPENMSKLKAKANLDKKNTDNMISSLQAVLGHMWKAVVRARKMDLSEETNYLLLIGSRGRSSPPLSQEYFGNSVGSGLATAKAGELMKEGLGFAAGLLNQEVNLYSNAKIRSGWENWLKEPRIICLNGYDGNILMTGSSPRFDMYGNDFGWGRPIGVRSGCANKYDGKLTIYPGVVKGSMEIEACLRPKTFVALGDDSEFLKYVNP